MNIPRSDPCSHRSKRPLLAAAHKAADNGQARRTTALALLLLLPADTQALADASEAEAAEQLVDAQAAEEAVDEAAQAEGVEQLADEAQHAGQQQADGGDDLEQGLGEQPPERVELLLGVRHVGDALLGVVDGGDDGGGELLEAVGQPVFLGRRLARVGAALGLRGDAAVRVEAAQGAVALLQDARAFFDERLDVVDELFLVKFVAGCAVGFLDVL